MNGVLIKRAVEKIFKEEGESLMGVLIVKKETRKCAIRANGVELNNS